MMQEWWDNLQHIKALIAEIERLKAIEEAAKVVWERYHIPGLRVGPYWEALGKALGVTSCCCPDEKAAMKVLRSCEWGYEDVCPSCGEPREDGHISGCKLKAALEEG